MWFWHVSTCLKKLYIGINHHSDFGILPTQFQEFHSQNQNSMWFDAVKSKLKAQNFWKRNMSKERMAGSKGSWMFLKKLTVCFRTGCLACRRAARGKPTRTPPTLRRNHGVFPDQLPEKGVVFPHCVLVPHWKASKVVPPNYCSYACWLITDLTWSNYSYDMWKSP